MSGDALPDASELARIVARYCPDADPRDVAGVVGRVQQDRRVTSPAGLLHARGKKGQLERELRLASAQREKADRAELARQRFDYRNEPCEHGEPGGLEAIPGVEPARPRCLFCWKAGVPPRSASTPAADTAAPSAPDADAEPAGGEVIGDPDDDHSGRVAVRIGNRNHRDIAADVAGVLLAHNEPPCLFRMGDDVAVLLTGDGTLAPLDKGNGAGWLDCVLGQVNFVSRPNDSPRIVGPSPLVMKLLAGMVTRKLPPVDGIVTAPYLSPAGRIVTDDGYDDESRLVLRKRGLDLPPLAERPSPREVADAVGLLATDLLGDFPFDTGADRAAALAELLTITGRQLFGVVPLFVNDASAAGSGKNLLTSVICLVATGELPHYMRLPADREEQGKVITAALLAGRSVLAWDESRVIAGQDLAMLMTADTYSGRLLGSSRMISVRNQFTQIALGNNVDVRGDMKRRVVPCRLVPDHANPSQRGGFRHPDLLAWAGRNRGRLLHAVLTIWRNWDARGRPKADLTMGGYERWVEAVGGALGAAGVTGFGSNRADWLSYSDEGDEWYFHLADLRRRFSDQAFTAADAADAIEARQIRRPSLGWNDSSPVAQRLGYAYRSHRDQWHHDLSLTGSKDRSSATGGRLWKVRQRGAATRTQPQ